MRTKVSRVSIRRLMQRTGRRLLFSARVGQQLEELILEEWTMLRIDYPRSDHCAGRLLYTLTDSFVRSLDFFLLILSFRPLPISFDFFSFLSISSDSIRLLPFDSFHSTLLDPFDFVRLGGTVLQNRLPILRAAICEISGVRGVMIG